MRVLLVEDEQHLAQALGQVLRQHNYTVDLAHDGVYGLDCGRTGIYDVIVLDIMLPKKNGLEVLRQLRQERISTPVLLLSAKGETQDKVTGLDLGADDYLPKPFKTEELLMVERERFVSKGSISNEVYEKLAQSSCVKEAVMSANFRGYSDKIRALDQKEGIQDTGNMNVVQIGPNGNQSTGNSKIPNLNILGGLNPEGVKEFENGTRSITEGKFPQKDGEAAISQDFAKLNDLQVGDVMHLQNPNDPENSPTLDLTISGIYYDGAKGQDLGFTHPMLNRKNEIITTFQTLKQYNQAAKKDTDLVAIDAKYYLKSPELAD